MAHPTLTKWVHDSTLELDYERSANIHRHRMKLKRWVVIGNVALLLVFIGALLEALA